MKWIFLVLTFSTIAAKAQSEEKAVRATIDRFFQGMYKSDTALISSALSPTAILQTVAKNKEGKLEVRNDDLQKFKASIAKPHEAAYDERIRFDMVKIDGELATAWTPYKFFVGDKFSHCGVNSFQLVKLDGEWKIQFIIDTRRKENCVE